MNVKRLLAVVCSSVIMLSALPVNAAELKKAPVPVSTNTKMTVSTYSDEYAQGYYKVTGTGVRFRSEAGLSGSIIATLAKGEYLYSERAAGPIVDKDGYRWMRCERYSTGEIGYVAMNYVTTTSAPPDAPYRLINWNR